MRHLSRAERLFEKIFVPRYRRSNFRWQTNKVIKLKVPEGDWKVEFARPLGYRLSDHHYSGRYAYDGYEDIERMVDRMPDEKAGQVLSLQYTMAKHNGLTNVTAFVKDDKGQPVSGPHITHSNNIAWDEIVKGILADDPEVVKLFEPANKIADQTLSERVTARGGKILFDDDEIDDSITQSISKALEEGKPVDEWKPLALFLENLATNPNEDSRDHLYRWIKANKLELDENGYIIAYKGVNVPNSSYGKAGIYKDDQGKEIKAKFVSRHAGNDEAAIDGILWEPDGVNGIPNPLGSVISMPRSKVTFDPYQACSKGLHVGSADYASSYGSYKLKVLVNPRDVVSVPNDDDSKVRVSRYTTVSEVGKYGS